MKSNNVCKIVQVIKGHLAFALSVSLLVLLASCSSTPTQESPAPEKANSSEKGSLEKKFTLDKSDSKNKTAKENEVVLTSVDSTAALPPGPPTPNPYLLTKPKISDQVEVSFRDALVDMQQKNWSSAEAKLQKIAVANPTLSGVFLNLGLVYCATNQPAKAEENFNRAINANSKNVDALNQLAVLKRESGDFVEAEVLYQKALTTWPFFAEGHKNIAILYDLYLGKPEMALPHYLAYQQLLAKPDKQVDSWVADLQRRLNGGKAPVKKAEAAPAKETDKAEAK